MTRFVANLLASILAFIAGIVTASSWTSKRVTVINRPPVVLERCPPDQTPKLPVTARHQEFDFAQGRLKLVPEQVQLKSESLRYNIDVTYPQIVGTENPQVVGKINQHLKELITQKYQWPLNPSKENLRFVEEQYPGTFNSVNLDYQVGVVTDSTLSIYFFGFSDTIGETRPTHESLTVNYDLTSGKALKLSDIFKPGAKYLEFISKYCIDELSRGGKRSRLNLQALAPAVENFTNWNITPGGITFNFDGCKVFACWQGNWQGDQTVEIPFADVKQLLKPGVPGKFKITYP